MEEKLQTILEKIEQKLQELKDEASQHLDIFWDEQRAINKGKKFSDKSVLGARMREKGDLFYLEWYWNFWIKETNSNSGRKMRPLSRHIKKGRGGFSYPARTLLIHAKEWEKEQILQWEKVFAAIREKVHYLVRIRQNIREYLQIESSQAFSENNSEIAY